MKNIGIIIAAVILLLIVAVGGVFFLKSSKAPTQTQSVNTQSAKPAANPTSDSILSLISGGKNVNCAITYPDNKGTGSIFVSDKKLPEILQQRCWWKANFRTYGFRRNFYVYLVRGYANRHKINLASAKNMAQNQLLVRVLMLIRKLIWNVHLGCRIIPNLRFQPTLNSRICQNF